VITIHKPQGLTLDKVGINIAKEFSAGLTFVVICSRVRHLSDAMFDLNSICFPACYKLFAKGVQLTERKIDDSRLCSVEHTSFTS